MSITHLLAAAALTCAPISAQAWFGTARYFPATDTIGFCPPGGHPGDFFTLGGLAGVAGQGTLDMPHLVKPGEVGITLSMQVFCFDPDSPTLFSATNGLWFQCGP